MRPKILILGLICLFIFTHCKKNLPTSPDLSEVTTLTINYFTATPSQILFGESSTLSWSVSNATRVIIDDIGDVSLTGSIEVSPEITTSYTLTAYDKDDYFIKSVVVDVIARANIIFIDGPYYSLSCDPDGSRYDVWGTVQNIGNVNALGLRIKVTGFDSDGECWHHQIFGLGHAITESGRVREFSKYMGIGYTTCEALKSGRMEIEPIWDER